MRRRYRRGLFVGRMSILRAVYIKGSSVVACLIHLRHQAAIALALVLAIACSPVIVTWVTALQIWRLWVRLFFHWRHPQLKLVESGSLRCALDTQRWPGLAVGLLLLDDVPLNEIRPRILDLIQRQVDGHPNLKRRVVSRFGCYLWRDATDSFDIDSHFVVWPKKAGNENQLQELAGTICSRPMAPQRPQWEVVLIPSARGWGLLVRSHHLLCEGLDEFLVPTSCGLWSNQTPPPLLRQKSAILDVASVLWQVLLTHWKTTRKTIDSFWLSKYVSFFPIILLSIPKLLIRISAQAHPFIFGQQRQRLTNASAEAWSAVKLLIAAPHVLTTQMVLPVENVPLLRAKVSPGYRVLAWTPPVTKDSVNRVATAASASDVHVVLAACAGTLRHLFITLNAAIPETVSAMVPVTIGERNTSAFALIALPTGEWDPCARLRLIRVQLEAVEKRPLNIVVGALVVKYATHLLPQPIITLALNFLSRRHPVTICCINSPPRLLPEQTQLFYWRPPQGNTGLTFTLMMDDETVTLAVASNQQVLPKPSVLTSHFSREITAMALGLRVRLDRRSMPRLPSS